MMFFVTIPTSRPLKCRKTNRPYPAPDDLCVIYCPLNAGFPINVAPLIMISLILYIVGFLKIFHNP